MKDKVCGAAYSSAWPLTSSYILGPWTDEIICFVDRTAASDPPPRYYFSKDRLNSTRELINASATVMTSYEYDVWGTPTESHLSGNVSTRYRFTASETSDRAALAWLGAVYPIPYDWVYCRWMSFDRRWERTRHIGPRDWMSVVTELERLTSYVPRLLGPERGCSPMPCLLFDRPGCASEACGEAGCLKKRRCMRCCVCAYKACCNGSSSPNYTREGSPGYCMTYCCNKHRGDDKPEHPLCRKPCDDAGERWEDKAICHFVMERAVYGDVVSGTRYKVCVYKCPETDTQQGVWWFKEDCKPCPAQQVCFEAVFRDETECCMVGGAANR